MKRSKSIACAVLALATIPLSRQHLFAQPAPAAPSRAAPAAGTPTNPAPTSTSDAQAKSKILASEPWKQVMSEFQKWLSSQPIYTPSDVKRINANLAAQIQAMPASELQGYIDDWQAKLKVLGGKNFQEAQQWLGAYLAPCADGYRRTVLKQLGMSDVANMTADQLEDAIVRIRAERMSIIQSQSAFEQGQQQMVQSTQRDVAASQQAVQQSTASRFGAPGFNTLQSPYRPPKYNPPPPPKLQFYMDSWGRIGYALPL